MEAEAFRQWMTIVTVIGTGVGTVLLQWLREWRARRWLEEDRRRDRRIAQEDAAALAAKVVREAELVKEALELERLRLSGEIEKATNAADSAYKEANHVNLKIEDLNERLLASTEQARETGENTLEAVQDQAERGDVVTRGVHDIASDIRDAQRNASDDDDTNGT